MVGFKLKLSEVVKLAVKEGGFYSYLRERRGAYPGFGLSKYYYVWEEFRKLMKSIK